MFAIFIRSLKFVLLCIRKFQQNQELLITKTILHDTEENPLCKMHIYAFINLFTY